MKLPILLVISMLSFVSIASSNPSKSNALFDFSTIVDKPGELIIAIPNFNNKRIETLIAAIRSVDGVQYVDRCPLLETFSITYDTNKFASADEAFNAIEKALNEFKILRKFGVSHTELIKMCEQR